MHTLAIIGWIIFGATVMGLTGALCAVKLASRFSRIEVDVDAIPEPGRPSDAAFAEQWRREDGK